jgi:hypothetical protein
MTTIEAYSLIRKASPGAELNAILELIGVAVANGTLEAPEEAPEAEYDEEEPEYDEELAAI